MTEQLETDRLILRRHKPEDAEAYIGFFLSDRARHVGKARTQFAAWRNFAMEAGHWALYGYGPWMVTRKGSDRSIGSIGCWQPKDYPERELSWLLWEDAEGQGIAFEAAQAARAHDYATHRPAALVSYIEAANKRSIRLAERLGALLDADAVSPDPSDLVYRHPWPEVLS
ncbi:MAG: GNAT family N-acetyltransferase [Pseudomonadota bacterium]